MFFFPLMPKARAMRRLARKLYAQAVSRARAPVFYRDFLVPDTLDGRFEMIALHAGLVINRVRNEGKDGLNLAQAIFDEMFLNMELSCRQVGIGDLSVPKHIKRMMKALQGRALTYERAAAEGGLTDALTTNLYATAEKPSAEILNKMGSYVMDNTSFLNSRSMDDIAQNQTLFAGLPRGDGDAEISKVA